MNQNHVLIAGGSGLVGSRLTSLLLKKGWKVSILSRKSGITNGITSFKWNPENQSIDRKAFEGITHLVNLAGESLSDQRWTSAFKEKIIRSRLDASATLLKALKEVPNTINSLVATSAIGIYGNRGSELVDENHETGTGFLAETCKQWEQSYEPSPVRTVLIRTGIVLSTEGGALVPMSRPLHYFVNPILGNGKQYMSWIHIDDLCGIFIAALENTEWNGIYNAVAPTPVTHKDFMLTLQKIISPKSISLHIPALILKLVLGEQSTIVLEGANVSSGKVIQSGYRFHYSKAEDALNNLYGC